MKTKKMNDDILKPNKQNLRIQKIILILKNKNMVTIREIAEAVQVTTMTVYRDIKILQSMNIASIFNGIVMYNKHFDDEEIQIRKGLIYDLPTESNRNLEAKKRIVKRAAEMLEDGDIIYIDAGSTMELFSREIPEDKKLVVACHAFYILANVQMKKGCDIIFAGGYYHHDTSVFECDESVQLLKKIRFTKSFFAAGGVDNTLGVTCANPFVVNIKRAILDSSLSKILLVDSSKFNTIKKVYYADLKEFDAVITDDGISDSSREYIRETGIKLYIT
ncbi:MAG: DeoR/GlpR family DNA-binding transcription regulator [Mobilitalea sp.]